MNRSMPTRSFAERVRSAVPRRPALPALLAVCFARTGRFGSLLGLVALIAGCSFDAKMRWTGSDASPLQAPPVEYRLQKGDRIGAVFMIRMRPDTAAGYRLESGDEIRLSVQDREDLASSALIAPDGMLYLPNLAPVRAAGLTVAALRDTLQERHRPVSSQARVSVQLGRFDGRANAFVTSLSQSSAQGPTYETTIGLDGQAGFPQIGFVQAEGATVRELAAELSRRYAEIVPRIDVTLRLTGFASSVVTVLGEVRRPGSFPVSGTMSLSAALGHAEGWLPSAKLADVVLVQTRGERTFVNKYDLHRDVLVATQIRLAGGDLVFLPRTAIGDVNVFVDQFIRRNLPVSVGVSVPLPVE